MNWGLSPLNPTYIGTETRGYEDDVESESIYPATDSMTAVLDTYPKIKPGIISNPLSGTNIKTIDALEKVLTEFPDIPHLKVRTPDDIQKALFLFARQGVNILLLNGGDGTIQAAVTCLMNQRPFPTQPLLALIQGGTANMTAKNLGIAGRPEKAVARLLLQLSAGVLPENAVQNRHVLKVQASALEEPLYGLFFGAGIICRGIRFFHERVKTVGIGGHAAHAVILIRFMLALATGDLKVASPIPMTIKMQPSGRQDRGRMYSDQVLLVAASTLDKLILGLRPSWTDEPDPVKFTAVLAHPRRLIRTVAGLVTGMGSKKLLPENGYISHNTERLELYFDDYFTLDGELYSTGRGDGPVTVENGGDLLFLRL